MKKFLLFLLVLIIALVVASQFLLPSFIKNIKAVVPPKAPEILS